MKISSKLISTSDSLVYSEVAHHYQTSTFEEEAQCENWIQKDGQQRSISHAIFHNNTFSFKSGTIDIAFRSLKVPIVAARHILAMFLCYIQASYLGKK